MCVGGQNADCDESNCITNESHNHGEEDKKERN